MCKANKGVVVVVVVLSLLASGCPMKFRRVEVLKFLAKRTGKKDEKKKKQIKIQKS